MCPNYLIYSFAHDMAVGVCARAVLGKVHDLISLHYLCGQLAFIMVQLRRPEIPEVFAIHFGEAWEIYCACHAYPHIKLKIFAQPEMVSIPPFHTHVHIGSLDGAWAHVASMGSSDAYLLVPNDGRPVIPLQFCHMCQGVSGQVYPRSRPGIALTKEKDACSADGGNYLPLTWDAIFLRQRAGC